MHGSDIELREHEELVLPHSGEVVDLADETACAVALDEVRRMQSHMNEAVRQLSAAIAARAAVLGTKTIPISGGRKAQIGGGPTNVIDALELQRLLRLAGMPEERLSEIVREEVSYRAVATEAKRAAAANPEYKRALDAATTIEEKPYSVTIRRR